MFRAALLCLSATLSLIGGCAPSNDRRGDEKTSAASAGGTQPEQSARVPRSETVEAVFTGWDTGDYVWARLKIKGREEFGAWSGRSPVDLFLDAHVGKPLTVTIETLSTDVPEAGGKIDVPRIAAARIGSLTAAAWWASLSAEQRQDAQIKLAGTIERSAPDPR